MPQASSKTHTRSDGEKIHHRPNKIRKQSSAWDRSSQSTP